MNRWATLSSAVTAPCFGPNGNLVVCTGSGHVIEFIDNDKGIPKANALMEIDGQPNSVIFESKNQLTICDPSSLALLTTDPRKQVSILCNEYESESFKGPSHCIKDNKARKFFTDSGPLGDTSISSPKGSLFMINEEGILMSLAYKCLCQPTDLVFSSDYKCLYVLEMLKNRILRFVETSSGLFIYSVFYQFNGCVGPTGIDIDNEGNLFVSRFEHKGLDLNGYLSVIQPSGKLVTEIPINAPEVTGVAYNKKTNMIYITEVSTNSIFQIHVDDIFSNTKSTKSLISNMY